MFLLPEGGFLFSQRKQKGKKNHGTGPSCRLTGHCPRYQNYAFNDREITVATLCFNGWCEPKSIALTFDNDAIEESLYAQGVVTFVL